MTELLRVTMAVLSVYRIAQFVTIDDGPYACFRRLRTYLGRKAAKSNSEDRWDFWRNMAELVHCQFCTGVWVSLAMVPLVLWPTLVMDAVLLWMGIAGGQAFLASLAGEN